MIESAGKRYQNIVETVAEHCSNFHMTVCLYIIYKLLLDFMYIAFIGNKHAFFGIYYSPINIINGYLIVIIMAQFFNNYYKQGSASSIMMVAFNMLYFIPMTTWCSFGGGSSSFLFWGIVYWSLLSILQIKTPIITSEGVIKRKSSGNRRVLILMTVIVSIPVLYIWIRYAGCRILYRLSEIYVARAEAATYVISTPLRYIFNLMPIAIALLIILSLKNRSYLLVLYQLLLLYIDFSIGGHKSTFLLPVILIGGYVLYRKEAISLILPAGIIMELLAMAGAKWNSGLIVSYAFRRMGLVLAQLSDYYYRFFMNNSVDLFRQGVIGKLGFKTIYSQKLPNVIGNNFETQLVNCNNGLMADAWANLGLIGIFVMPVILIFCLRLMDFVSHKMDTRMIIGIILYYAVSFTNSQWSTVLLTHGFAFTCIVLVFFPREKSVSEQVLE